MDDRTLLAEQIDYYRARAPEYDRWWHRTHQYELPPERKAEWDRDVTMLEQWVDGLAPLGDVLELACGTGIWTERLMPLAAAITAVDASPETLALNHDKIRSDRVAYVEADLFDWQPPPDRFDTVFFSFWISHVPPAVWAAFWEMVGTALRPGGRAVYIDNRWAPKDWPPQRPSGYVQQRSDISSDDRTYSVVKRYLEPAELDAELAALGWNAKTQATPTFFVYGEARPTQ